MEIEFEGQKYTVTTLRNGKVRIADSEGLMVLCNSIEDFITELDGTDGL